METIFKTWRPVFNENIICSQWKLFLWLVENNFFYLSDNPGCKSSFSVKRKCIFLTNCSFRLAETNFLSSGKIVFLFIALLKLLKFGGNSSCNWQFFFHFSDIPPSESYFPSSVNVFLNNSSNLYGGDTFSVL